MSVSVFKNIISSALIKNEIKFNNSNYKGGCFLIMYDVLLMAKYIIKYCNKSNLPISNLKLQKLLYFIQAAFLVEKGHACFPDEIEAWDFGPVVPAVYYKYKI